MYKVISSIQIITRFIVRAVTALRYMRKLNYSRRLAWAKAAR